MITPFPIMNRAPEIAELLSLSARVGRNPLLVQASSGNTSIKLGGKLWIKASGKWLARAGKEQILVPVDLASTRADFCAGREISRAGIWVKDTCLQPSIETAMHAILSDAVTIHVHSVNAISWAVRHDAPERLAECLHGMRWSWIPYVASGVPLARAISKAVQQQPGTGVFVLANHGLVISAESCEAAERLLEEVERRVAVMARPCGETEHGGLLPLDCVSERVLKGGMLYPCQVIFLGAAYVIIEGRGMMTNRGITSTQRAVLDGLLKVARRVQAGAPIRYLSGIEVFSLLNNDAHDYQRSTEKNAPAVNELSAHQ